MTIHNTLDGIPRLRDDLALGYALAKQVPDMLQRGVRIETSYGELDLDEEDSIAVANLVKTRLEAKLAKARKAVA